MLVTVVVVVVEVVMVVAEVAVAVVAKVGLVMEAVEAVEVVAMVIDLPVCTHILYAVLRFRVHIRSLGTILTCAFTAGFPLLCLGPV